ncbi:MAG TPA: TIGR03668 family PPOX class F420-dependent oxidoreductase [Actinomycetota bacterium]|jgi:PPOX class probable F420-dependent enzyme|nr:TIGR03668 family PPOX class F420-dependent oxidoreductase [Actinomycetota bacterium]
MDRGEAIARLRSARVGRLATVTADARPHVVPFVFAIVERDLDVVAYWGVDRKPKRTERLQRLRNLERNPAAEFVVDGYDEDWRALWWVRASGTGRVLDDTSREHTVGLEALTSKYRQYTSEPPPGPVVAIDIDRISGWRAEPRLGDCP